MEHLLVGGRGELSIQIRKVLVHVFDQLERVTVLLGRGYQPFLINMRMFQNVVQNLCIGLMVGINGRHASTW
jgi:hypothetical protein